MAPHALGDTRSQLNAAKAKLADLQQQISNATATIARLQTNLSALGSRIEGATATLARTRADVVRTQDQIATTEARYQQIRARLGQRAAAAYELGPGSTLAALLGTTSYADLADGLEYTESIARADAALGQAAQLDAELLNRQQTALTAAQVRQTKALAQLDADRKGVASDLAGQQAALASLAAARSDAAALVAKLQKQLAREELLAALRAIHGGTPIPFGQWAGLILGRLGAPACQSNLTLVVAWQATEFTMARFNPLSTTYPMAGASVFNWAGVRNYVSLDQGLTAEVDTLFQPIPSYGYGAIVADLRACASPRTTALAVANSAYCGCGSSYPLVGLVPIVEANYEQYAKLCTGC